MVYIKGIFKNEFLAVADEKVSSYVLSRAEEVHDQKTRGNGKYKIEILLKNGETKSIKFLMKENEDNYRYLKDLLRK